MRPFPVTVEQIDRIPKDSSWDLPRDEKYVRFGCVACPQVMCIKIKGLTSDVPKWSRNSEAATALDTILNGIEKKKEIREGSISVWEDACEDPCPQMEEVAAAVELLNETFSANLVSPQT